MALEPPRSPFYQNHTMACMKGRASMLIADYVLRQVAKSGHSITPFQVIKTVFISHGRYFAVTGEPLIRDRIDAW